jgi:hypothetical protein
MVRVKVAELRDDPAGEPVIVRMYVPGGTTVVVEIKSVEVAPCAVGVTVAGEKPIEPHGPGLLDWQIAGLGELENSRVTG